MKISKVDLFNFRCFEHKSVSLCNNANIVRPFTVIIGDNAIGKTAILEGIAKGFIPVLRQINKNVANTNDFKDLSDTDIKSGTKWTAIELNAFYDGIEYSWHNHRRQSTFVEMKELGEQKQQRAIKEAIMKNLESKNDEKKIPLIIYYSINRMIVDVPVRRSSRGGITGIDPTEALDNSLTSKNDFRRFYNWFKSEEENELRIQRTNRAYQSLKLNAVRNAINSVMSGYQNLRIEGQPSRMVMDNVNGNEFNVMQLSGGYKAVFSLVSDIASRLALANPYAVNPLNCEALILIDELDLHLHPKWQKTIVQDLKRTFPQSQFIVTTHSPFIVQSLDLNEVINLESDEFEQELGGNYKGWSLDEVQEYEMGVDKKTSEYADLLKQFELAISVDDSENAKRLYDCITEMLHPNSNIGKLLKLDMVALGENVDDKD